MNQINLEKLLQSASLTSAAKTGVNAGELKLLVGELYNARLQMLPAGTQIQLKTSQGPLNINLPAQQAQQINQQLGSQLQLKFNPVSNNQLILTLQSPAGAASSISLSPAQLQPLLTHWLSPQLPQASQTTGSNRAQISGQATTNNPKSANSIALIAAVDSKSGQLQLAQPASAGNVLITLSSKELTALTQLMQQSAISQQGLIQQSTQQQAGNRLSVIVNIIVNQSNGRLELSLQLPTADKPSAQAQSAPVSSQLLAATPKLASVAPKAASVAIGSNSNSISLALSSTSQHQLLQALVSQLLPIKLPVAPGATKISLGQLSVSMPPQLIKTLASYASAVQAPTTAHGAAAAQGTALPAAQQTSPVTSALSVILQLQPPAAKNGSWQLVMQPVSPSQQLTVTQNQADRPLSFINPGEKVSVPVNTASNAVNQATNNLPPVTRLTAETRSQAWRNLLPLLSQPLLQPNNLPNLPVALQNLLNQIQQSLPEVSKPISAPAIAAQLSALLQFQPLQSQPNPQTAGGSLALAIQLLLGQLTQRQLTPAQNPVTNKLAQLVSQLEPGQASAALRQLSTISSPLQQSQLATLDTQSQLQQWLLQLPLQQQGQNVMPQLLLEQRQAEGSSAESKQKQWQLTMRFDLQKYGKLLAVAKLQEQDLKLQFYTDHNQALRLAQKFLPLLKDRCAAQGLTVSQADCQLGKIPESLLPRHNSLLTVRV